jgi:hypothetical protein
VRGASSNKAKAKKRAAASRADGAQSSLRVAARPGGTVSAKQPAVLDEEGDDEPVSLWENRVTFTVRVVPGILERARWRNNLAYSLTNKLTVGIEYNPLADDIHPTANWRLLDEKGNRPAIMLGTSSDRIGTPSGTAWFATVSKSLKQWTAVPISPYAGVSYSTYDDRAYPIGGANINLTDRLSLMAIYDGVNTHGALSYTVGRHTFSALAVDLDGWYFGAGYSVRF